MRETASDPDEILYLSDMTRIIRRRTPTGSVIVKQNVGDAQKHLRNELRILKRLKGIDGVSTLAPQALGGAPHELILVDTGSISLADALRASRMPIPRVMAFAIRLAEIIADVHRAGIIHLDINPANILLGTSTDAPILIDFDLAATFNKKQMRFQTQPGIHGTLDYLAPEQTGRMSRTPDQRADLYSLGVTLYEMTTGRLPFAGQDPLEVLHDHLALVSASPYMLDHGVPEGLSDIIMRLTEKDPDQRYQSAEGLLYDLKMLDKALGRGERRLALLGMRDFPAHFMPPTQIIGRERELAALRLALEDSHCTQGCFGMITGEAGVGKTMLTKELRSMTAEKSGWFIEAQADEHRYDTGPGLIVGALGMLGGLLLSEPETRLRTATQRIRRGLGSSIGLITAMVPEFALLFGDEHETANDRSAEAEKRLGVAVVYLLRALTSLRHPLVMVLGDLQWINDSSLNVMSTIIQGGVPGLLVLGTYRETDVTPTHPLAHAMARWEQLGLAPEMLRLENFGRKDLASLLGSMLRLPAEDLDGLSAAMSTHTRGNPFDTVELLNALRSENILELGADGWTWDNKKVRRFVSKTEAVGLLASRIARLPQESRNVLEILACLGGRPSPELLHAASALPTSTLTSQLTFLTEEGLLAEDKNTGGASCALGSSAHFRHNRVRQATYSLIGIEREGALHLTIARRLARHSEYSAEAAEQYFLAAGQLHDPGEIRRAMQLIHAAARNLLLVNHGAAERFLSTARTLLDKIETPQDGPLSVSLDIDLHSALYHVGRLDESDRVFASIRDRGDDPLLLVRPTSTQVLSLIHRGMHQAAIDLGLELLSQLGLDVSMDTDSNGLLRLDALYAWVEDDPDALRADAQDPVILAEARIMNLLTMSAVLIDQRLLSWLVVKSAELWMQNGPCAPLIPIICRAPLASISQRDDYHIGYRAARKALAVSEAHGWEPETSEARLGFVTGAAHWAEPLQDSIGQAALAREGTIRAGDFQSACYSYMPALAAYLDCGPTVDDLVSEAKGAIDLARRTNMNWTLPSMLVARQIGRALKGETEQVGSLGDTEFDESAYSAGRGCTPFSTGLFHIYRAFTSALFRDAAGLEEHSSAAMSFLPLFTGNYFLVLAYLMRALALAEKARTVPSERENALTGLEASIDWLAARAQDAPENYSHLVALLRAERAWVIGEYPLALRLFETALNLTSPSQRPWHYAFICERQARLCMEYGLDHAGLGLMAQARDTYASWGATAKVAQLQNTYASLHPSKTRQARSLGHSSSVSNSDIDLLAILKASQALSSETNPETLSIRVREVLKNMTGATHMLVMLYDEVMQAWMPTTDTERPDQNQALSLENAAQEGLLPLSAFGYVERTRQTLVVDDVRQDSRFADDPYFAGLAHGSLLVFPLLSHGRLRAIIMCENRLVRGVFTTERLDAVNLIAGQLTVSLDNARLYVDLESTVAERTEALETANRRLEELSITDPLTSLANRRHLTDALASELLRARRSKSPVGMAMIDIDHFKLYNDRYGHILGDTCLRRVSSVLADSVRQGVDLVARYGGEEFAIVLPGADLETVAGVAERAREAVAALAEPNEDTDLGTVTISVGITSITPDEGSFAEELVQRADAALYAAKANGRNRVARYEEEAPETERHR